MLLKKEKLGFKIRSYAINIENFEEEQKFFLVVGLNGLKVPFGHRKCGAKEQG